jgi:hypothetical protein
MASCVAVGCFTVKAYRDMEEKLVMVGNGRALAQVLQSRRYLKTRG